MIIFITQTAAVSQMESESLVCILCESETGRGVALCDHCATDALQPFWHSEIPASGAARLHCIVPVMLMRGKSFDCYPEYRRLSELLDEYEDSPDGVSRLHNLLLSMLSLAGDAGKGWKEQKLPPWYEIASLLSAVERLNETLPEEERDAACLTLGLFYLSAALNYSMPLTTKHFADSRKAELAQKAMMWLGKVELITHDVTEASILARKIIANSKESGRPSPYDAANRIRSIREKLSMAKQELSAKLERKKAEAERKRAENARQRAYLHYLTGQFQRALTEISASIGSGGGDQSDYLLASFSALRTGNFESIQMLERNAKSSGITYDPLLFEAVIAWREGKWGRAMQLTARDLQDRRSAAAFLFLKNLWIQYGMEERTRNMESSWDEASFQQGIDFLACIYLSLGLWGAAIQTLKTVPDASWKDETWALMGWALEEKGDNREALSAYQKALSSNSRNTTAAVRAARIHCMEGDHQKAFELLCTLEGALPSSLRLQGEELIHQGKKAEGLERLALAVKYDPDDVEAAMAGYETAQQLKDSSKADFFKNVAGGKH